MRILLDTHSWLWMTSAPEKLSSAARALMEKADHELYLSAASAWEIAIKSGLGRLRLPEPPERYIPSRLLLTGVHALPIDCGHAARVASLPPHHKDPFDRLLIAQAQLDNLAILTADQEFNAYDVRTIAA